MKRFVWTDTETTDYKPGFIIEVACIVTDEKLTELGRFHSLVEPPPREEWNPSTWAFHDSNGLVADLAAISDLPTNAAVERAFSQFLREYCGEPAERERDRTSCLAGNSVHFDAQFLDACMPAAARFFHYRRLDVTAMRMGMEIVLEHELEPAKALKHRALRDIEESIEQFKGLWATVLDELTAGDEVYKKGAFPWQDA